jgi:excisionase family DNA binding protein
MARTVVVRKATDPGAVLTRDQVAERLGVTPRQVKRWIDERRIGFIQLPQGRRITEAQLTEFVNSRAVDRVA